MKSIKWNKCLTALTATCALMIVASPARAEYPQQPISLIVPYATGGAVDVVGRIVGAALAEQLGQSVVVENKAGAAGNIGAQFVKRAKPDGYTLLMAATTSYALNGKLMDKSVVGFDLLKDFTPVSMVGELPILLVVNQGMGVKTVPELVAKLKAEPGRHAYASAGPGTVEQAVAEMFRMREGLQLLHVPYRGAAPAMVDLLSGQTQIMFATAPTALANLGSGRITALGVASAKRIPVLLDLPTMIEQGLPGFTAQSVYGILVAKGTPDAIVQKLNAAMKTMSDSPQFREKLQQQGIVPLYTTVPQSRERLDGEVAKWSKVIDDAKITLQ